MNIDSLNARLKTLFEQRNQTIANVNALNGAIEEVQNWIFQLSSAKPEAQKSTESN